MYVFFMADKTVSEDGSKSITLTKVKKSCMCLLLRWEISSIRSAFPKKRHFKWIKVNWAGPLMDFAFHTNLTAFTNKEHFYSLCTYSEHHRSYRKFWKVKRLSPISIRNYGAAEAGRMASTHSATTMPLLRLGEREHQTFLLKRSTIYVTQIY